MDEALRHATDVVEVLKWVIGILTTSIGALAFAIVALWKAQTRRNEKFEAEKDQLQKEWREMLAGLLEKHHDVLSELNVTVDRLVREAERPK